MVARYDPAVRKYARKIPRTSCRPAPRHIERREGDEMACSCGARWDTGESHP